MKAHKPRLDSREPALKSQRLRNVLSFASLGCLSVACHCLMPRALGCPCSLQVRWVTCCPSPQVSGCSTGSPAGFSAPAASSRQHSRQRITRVNLRDLIFYMEQERETARSLLLYRALLK